MDDSQILLRCEITQPDDLIVLDPTLVEAVDVTTGLKPGGTILINSRREPQAYERLAETYRVATVDANTIAVRHGLGTRTQPIVNTALIGAFSSAFGLVGMDAVCEAIREEVPIKQDENIEAALEAAEAVRTLGEREALHV